MAKIKLAGISTTVKIHILAHHVEQFIKKYGYGLGVINEQASEAIHSDFKPANKRFKRNNITPDYDNQYLRSVADYNSFHL